MGYGQWTSQSQPNHSLLSVSLEIGFEKLKNKDDEFFKKLAK